MRDVVWPGGLSLGYGKSSWGGPKGESNYRRTRWKNPFSILTGERGCSSDFSGLNIVNTSNLQNPSNILEFRLQESSTANRKVLAAALPTTVGQK